MSADVVDEGRINVCELWESDEALRAFRGSGPSSGQLAKLIDIDVREYLVSD